MGETEPLNISMPKQIQENDSKETQRIKKIYSYCLQLCFTFFPIFHLKIFISFRIRVMSLLNTCILINYLLIRLWYNINQKEY